MSDIVEKLVEKLRSKYCCDTPNCSCDEAADEITRLRVEVERLRAALKKIAKPEPYLWKTEYFIGTARTALGDTHE